MPLSSDNFLIQDRLWLFTTPTHVPIYDFNFRQFFDCRSPYQSPPNPIPAVARIGAFSDYAALHAEVAATGGTLINTPEQHERASFLPLWYPLLTDHTPRSRWFDQFPPFAELEAEFGLPFFLKGSRQTSRHQASLSIIKSQADHEAARLAYQQDPILRWQQIVCREFIPLRSIPGGSPRRQWPLLV
jgi:hypothetical protein